MNPMTGLRTTGEGGSGGSEMGGGGGGKKPGKGGNKGSGRKRRRAKKATTKGVGGEANPGGSSGGRRTRKRRGERGVPNVENENPIHDQENYPFPSTEELLPIDPPNGDSESRPLYDITAWRIYLHLSGFSDYAVGRMTWIRNNGLIVERQEEVLELMRQCMVVMDVENRSEDYGRLNMDALSVAMNRLEEMKSINPEVADFSEKMVNVRAVLAAVNAW